MTRAKKKAIDSALGKTPDMKQEKVTRGKGGRFESKEAKTSTAKDDTQTKESLAHKIEGRPERIPMSVGLKLRVPDHLKQEGYTLRWCRDDAETGNIDMYLQAWWEFVTNEKGEKIMRPGGGGAKLILMRLPTELYLQDMKALEKLNIDATVEASKPKKFDDGQNMDEYIPGDREYVVQRDRI